MSSFARLRLCVATATLLLSLPASAHAPPIGSGVYWYPHGTGERMVVRTNRGLLVSDDSGASFRLLCNEAFSAAVTEIAPMTFTEEGRVLLVTAEAGLLADDGTLCSWSPVDVASPGTRGVDIARAPLDPEAFYLVVSQPASDENFFVSRDAGETWISLGASDVIPTGVLVAPSDPNKIYRLGAEFSAEGSLVTIIETSSDGAATWEKHEILLQDTELRPLPLAVDPQDPERLYLRLEATSRQYPERLVVSVDGGATFSTLLTEGVLQGFAMSPDGATLWVGAVDGLWRSIDRGVTFEQLPASGLARFGCLAYHEEELYACAVQDNEFGVSVSTDGGASFRRFLRFPDVVEPLSCPAGTQGKELCELPFVDWANELFIGRDAGSAPVVGAGGTASGVAGGANPGAGATAGVGGSAEADGDASGCGCRFGGFSGWSSGALASALTVLGASAGFLRRRSRRGACLRDKPVKVQKFSSTT